MGSSLCRCGSVEPEDAVSQWSGMETPRIDCRDGPLSTLEIGSEDDDEQWMRNVTGHGVMYTPRSAFTDDSDGFPIPAKRWTHANPTKLIVEDGTTGKYYWPNGQGWLIDNEVFKGRAVMVTRTAKEDLFFAGKKRHCEVQVQGRFKSRPQGVIWLGAEAQNDLKLTGMSAFWAGLCIKCAQLFNSMVDIKCDGQEGTDETPHMMLPINKICDSWICTNPGETPPRLGTRLPLAGLKEFRKEYKADYEIDPSLTYTFSWHSMYFDFENWQVANIVGATGTKLSTFWGTQPLTLTAYCMQEDAPHHGKSQRKPLFDCTLHHAEHPGWEELIPKITNDR